MAEKPQEEQQRWTAKRRVALVVSIMKGETSRQEAARRPKPAPARKHVLKAAEVEDWRDRFLVGVRAIRRYRTRAREES